MAEVTISNAQLIELFERYRADGFGYAGVERHARGWLAGKQMAEVARGRQDARLSLLAEAERGQSYATQRLPHSFSPRCDWPLRRAYPRSYSPAERCKA
jgi:hypothetical protein